MSPWGTPFPSLSPMYSRCCGAYMRVTLSDGEAASDSPLLMLIRLKVTMTFQRRFMPFSVTSGDLRRLWYQDWWY